MASQWYYLRDGNQYGPVATAQLREFAASGELTPADLVWKEGMAEWLPASDLQGLFPKPPEAPAVLSYATPKPKLSWIDKQLIQTSWFALIALTVLFFGLMLIFSVVAVIVSRDPTARKKAKIMFSICMGYIALVVLIGVAATLLSR